jgi:tRNA modification GTPase
VTVGSGSWGSREKPALSPGIQNVIEEGVGDQRQPATPGVSARQGGAFVGRLTAPGRGAIAVLRVWGPSAVAIADAVFRPHRGARLAETPRGQLRLGRIGHGIGDEVVAVVLGGDPPAVEVQCHGGAAAITLVCEALHAAGATLAEETRIVGQISHDPITRDALADLALAPTVATAEILLDQAQGALRGELMRLGQSIADAPDRSLVAIETLIARAQVGLRLLRGWSVVIAGRPNVGKSRLFNALLGFARAIVDPTAGTTRDVVSHRAVFGGWPVELADTAGLRESLDLVESMGIERSRREQQRADLIVLVLDRSVPLQPIDRELIASQPPAIVVANKSDLPPAWHDHDFDLRSRAIVTVSAENGEGLSGLVDAIGFKLVPEPPPQGAAVPFREEQVAQLRQTRMSLLAGDLAEGARLIAKMLNGGQRPDPSEGVTE